MVPGVIEVAGELIGLLPLRVGFLLTGLTGLLPVLAGLPALDLRLVLRARLMSGVCLGFAVDACRGR